MRKMFLLLLVFVAIAGRAEADALFNSSFIISVTPPRGLDLAHAFNILIVADPVVSTLKDNHGGNAGVSLSPPASGLSITPLNLVLRAGASGFAKQPGGHAEGESGGFSYTLRFTNIQTVGLDIAFDTVGDAILNAEADPGDSADASFGVSVFVSRSDGTVLSNGKGDAIFAPPKTSRTVPLDFLVPTGPIPPGGFFDLVIRGFAAGSATAVPEPSSLTLTLVGLLSLAVAAVRRQRRHLSISG